jgi:hypothetical protein
VPEISRFFGIIITITTASTTLRIFTRGMPAWTSRCGSPTEASAAQRRALALVLEWWHLHRAELLEDWNLAQTGSSLKKIEPLD